MKKIYLALFSLLILAVSCKKEDAPIEKEPSGSTPGFGKSTAAFSGVNWKLPQGIVLKDSIRDMEWWTDIHGGQPVPFGGYSGLPGGTFMVCLYLENTTGGAITIQFPEEILILSNTIETQNGLIINLETITIPAHSETVIFAEAFCINLSRSVPGLYTPDGNLQAFSFGPATVPAQIKEITSILKPKNIRHSSLLLPDGTPDPIKMIQMSEVQDAIWEVTDEGGLTPETRAALQNLHF